ncbi:MAG: hypothetical protein FD138_2652 [Planctomycetota bacterium]|nr:MAG: hypothetical protein FD138_2652 [Planctomycetota bacterium]
MSISCWGTSPKTPKTAAPRTIDPRRWPRLTIGSRVPSVGTSPKSHRRKLDASPSTSRRHNFADCARPPKKLPSGCRVRVRVFSFPAAERFSLGESQRRPRDCKTRTSLHCPNYSARASQMRRVPSRSRSWRPNANCRFSARPLEQLAAITPTRRASEGSLTPPLACASGWFFQTTFARSSQLVA